jgi:hypothetical protein
LTASRQTWTRRSGLGKGAILSFRRRRRRRGRRSRRKRRRHRRRPVSHARRSSWVSVRVPELELSLVSVIILLIGLK